MKVRLKFNRTFISNYVLLLKLMTMFVQQQNATPSNIVAFNFLLIAFLTGIASAFQTPTLSLYLSQEIQVFTFFLLACSIPSMPLLALS